MTYNDLLKIVMAMDNGHLAYPTSEREQTISDRQFKEEIIRAFQERSSHSKPPLTEQQILKRNIEEENRKKQQKQEYINNLEKEILHTQMRLNKLTQEYIQLNQQNR